MKKLFLLFFLLLLAGCKTKSDITLLTSMMQADQKERLENNPNYSANDIARLAYVKNLVKLNRLKTSNDFFNAAVLFQHGDSAADFLQANKLAQKALSADKKNQGAKTLIAQSLDRYLLASGKLQQYGTQRYVFRNKEYLRPIDTTVVTEKQRSEFGVNTLAAKLKYFNDLYQKNEKSIFAYVIQDSVREKLLAENPTEIIGGLQSIFQEIHYPELARQNKISGKVLLEFAIDKNGNLKDCIVAKGLGYGCDEEAIRVLKLATFANYVGEDSYMRVSIPFVLPQ